ncbi:MAG TPA: hypothetical protein OQH54_04155 [Nitrosopumilus sp.]|nr:hypothetical protein [Thermoproteota archaeon]HJJ22891.1 hypothetical protein [Nitrosopumilus sp.]
MLSTSALSITDSFADLIDYQDEKDNNQDATKDIPNSKLRIIITEKLVNGRLQVLHYALVADFSDDDEGNDKYISFMNYSLNPEMGKNIKFLQIEELVINSEKPDECNQEFRNSILVI